MVLEESPNSYSIEYLAVKNQGSGVEQSLILLALKYCLKKGKEFTIKVVIKDEFIKKHQEDVFIPILT